jgi:hypothetical protein
MKSQTLNLIMEKPAKRIALSVALSIALANTAITLPVYAQGYNQDSYLPPEVVPINQSVNYGPALTSVKSIANILPVGTGSNVPGTISQITQQQNFQTPQEARQAIYDSWANNKIFPQFNGSSYNEATNPMNNLANQSISSQNFPAGQIQNLGQTMPQDLDNRMNPTANNYQNDAAPPQTQTLSGATNTPSTSQQRTSGGISHAYSMVSTLGSTGMALSSGGIGNVYNAGLLGLTLTNYSANNGLKF